MTRIAMLLLAGVFSVTPVFAEEVVVMSAGALEPGLRTATAAFEAATGHRVTLRFGTGPQLTERLEGGEAGDLLLAPNQVMDRALRAGHVDVDIVAPIGRVGVGIVMRAGARIPDVSTADALRDALVRAPEIVFNRASTGQYIERLLVQFGIEQHVTGKVVRVDTGEAVMERISAGAVNEIGFGAITEIRMQESRGIQFVAPLPVAVQNFTTYEGAIMRGAKAPRAAEALLEFLLGETGRELLQESGVQP